ncbi:MAG: hypothetical protein ACRD3O_09015 [Terriglobia bacterium]
MTILAPAASILLTGNQLIEKWKASCVGLLVVAFSLALGWTPLLRAEQPARKAERLSFRDDFRSGNLNAWTMPYPEDWEILTKNGLHYLHMKRSRPPGVPRRPLQFARLRNIRVGSFDLEAKVRREGGSMIIVFNYVDTLHFYYVHLSVNPGKEIAVHNGIFIVDGGPRRRIAGLSAMPALPNRSWHTVRIVRDIRSGSIRVFMDGHTQPLFATTDRTFTCGQIGLGSFDETGDFAEIRLHSNDAGCSASRRGQ